MTDHTPSWHELFPPRDEDPRDAEPPVIAAIYVRKMQPTNKFDSYPQPFSPDELVSLSQVYAQWGGGLYEFVARDDARRLTRKHQERIAGPPKPWPGIVDDDPAGAASTGLGEAPARAAPNGSTSTPGWVGVVGVLGPLALEYLKYQAQTAQTQQQQFQMMMTTLLDRGAASGQQHLQAMAQMYSHMPEMFAKVMSQGAGGGTSEAFLKGLETAQELYEGMRDAQGDGDLDTGSLLQAMQGFMQFMQQQGGPVPGSGMPNMPSVAAPARPPPAPAGDPPDPVN
jgi:hypothetical protein